MLQDYLDELRGKFLRELRIKKKLSQNELAFRFDTFGNEKYDVKKNYSSRSSISRIENGKSSPNNESVITEYMIGNYLDEFNVSQDVIRYGTDDIAEKFCRHLFDQFAKNYDTSQETEQLHSEIIKMMCSIGNFSIMYSEYEYESFRYYLKLDYSKLTTEAAVIFNYALEFAWQLVKDEFIESYFNYFLGNYFPMYKFESELVEWLNQDILNIINRNISVLKQNNLYKIGYQIRDIIILLYSLIEESEEQNKLLSITSNDSRSNHDIEDKIELNKEIINIYESIKFELAATQQKYLNYKFNISNVIL